MSWRKTNNDYPTFLAEQCQNWCEEKNIKKPRIALLGVTFKENVPDIRNSKAFDLLAALNDISPYLCVFDPIADLDCDELSFPLNPENKESTFDVIVLAVPHSLR